MNESIADKAVARLLNVQMRLDRAAFAAERAQSRITAASERLERTGHEIFLLTVELDRLHRLRRS